MPPAGRAIWAVDKLYGNARIRASLMEKGIASDLIEEALKETRAELSETEGLDRLLQKKGSSVTVESSEAGETERRVPKLLQALVRKGYPLEMVYEKLRKLKIGHTGRLVLSLFFALSATWREKIHSNEDASRRDAKTAKME